MMQILANGIIAGSGYALFALGFSLVHGTGRFFHMAHGGSYVFGAYVAYALAIRLGLGTIVGVCGGVIAAGMLGAAMDVLVYRPLRRRHATSESMFLASLGLMICIQNAVSLVFGDQPRVLRAGLLEPGSLVLGARITPAQMGAVLTCTMATGVTWFLLQRTLLGLRIRALASSQELATVYGLDPTRTFLIVIILASALGGLVGVLAALDTDLTPSMGFHAQIMGVAAAIVGGIGSVRGAVIGGFLIGLAQHLTVLVVPTQWQEAIVFVVVTIFLCCRTAGVSRRAVIA